MTDEFNGGEVGQPPEKLEGIDALGSLLTEEDMIKASEMLQNGEPDHNDLKALSEVSGPPDPAKTSTSVDPATGKETVNYTINMEAAVQVIKREGLEDDDVLLINFPKGVTQEALPILTQQFKENFPNNNLMFTDDTIELRILERKPGKTVEEVIEEAGIALDDGDT